MFLLAFALKIWPIWKMFGVRNVIPIGKRRARSGLALLSCCAALSGCGGGHEANPRGSITTAIGSDILSSQPGVNRDENTDVVMMPVFEGLVGIRENGVPAPLLADTVTVSPDGLGYRFRLRRGLRFSNGAPVTAADVVWTWRRYLNAATGWLCLPGFDGTVGPRVLSVTRADALSVDFRLDRPDPMFLSRMAAPECGGSAILSRASVRPDGSWLAPVSTGPYVLAHWRRGEYIDLARNPYYRALPGATDGYVGGKHALAPVIRFYIIRDSASRLAGLLDGQLDVLPSLTRTDSQQLADYPGITIDDAPIAGVNAILIQSDAPIMRDIRVRKALALAIDLKGITALATGGRGVANPSMVPAASPFHSPVQNLHYPHDVALARKLLAEAGYHGEPITLITNRRYVDQFDQSLLVQSMARDAGFNIVLEVLDWATELDRYHRGDYQLMSFAYSARADPYAGYNSIIGDRSSDKKKVWGSKDAIETLKEVADADVASRKQALLDDLHRMMIRDLPLIVLYNSSDSNALRPGVSGFRSWMMARARFWNVQKGDTRP